MISEELLSEVFEQEIRFIKYVANNTYEVHFEKPIRLKYIIINIYEIAHKCKEWANNLPSKRYQLYSGICPKSLNYSVCSIFSGAIEQTEEIIANSELEAIFSACQWILDNKGIK